MYYWIYILFSGYHQGGISTEANLIIPKMGKKILQAQRTKFILCQRFQGRTPFLDLFAFRSILFVNIFYFETLFLPSIIFASIFWWKRQNYGIRNNIIVAVDHCLNFQWARVKYPSLLLKAKTIDRRFTPRNAPVSSVFGTIKWWNISEEKWKYKHFSSKFTAEI